MVIIWDIAGQQQKGSRGKAGAQSSLPLQDQPRHILYGHQDAVICLAVCTQLDLVVSAAADGNLLIHTLSSGRYDMFPKLSAYPHSSTWRSFGLVVARDSMKSFCVTATVS